MLYAAKESGPHDVPTHTKCTAMTVISDILIWYHVTLYCMYMSIIIVTSDPLPSVYARALRINRDRE